jgi:hypothetical protein
MCVIMIMSKYWSWVPKVSGIIARAAPVIGAVLAPVCPWCAAIGVGVGAIAGGVNALTNDTSTDLERVQGARKAYDAGKATAHFAKNQDWKSNVDQVKSNLNVNNINTVASNAVHARTNWQM